MRGWLTVAALCVIPAGIGLLQLCSKEEAAKPDKFTKDVRVPEYYLADCRKTGFSIEQCRFLVSRHPAYHEPLIDEAIWKEACDQTQACKD